jgi:hypothetical protein
MSWIFTFASSFDAAGVCALDLAFDLDFELDFDLDLDDRGAGGGTVAETDALKIAPPFGDRWREIICVKEVLNVAREVSVELPLGKRMRSSCGDVGSGVVDFESVGGGVHDDKEDLRVLGS